MSFLESTPGSLSACGLGSISGLNPPPKPKNLTLTQDTLQTTQLEVL